MAPRWKVDISFCHYAPQPHILSLNHAGQRSTKWYRHNIFQPWWAETVWTWVMLTEVSIDRAQCSADQICWVVLELFLELEIGGRCVVSIHLIKNLPMSSDSVGQFINLIHRLKIDFSLVNKYTLVLRWPAHRIHSPFSEKSHSIQFALHRTCEPNWKEIQ